MALGVGAYEGAVLKSIQDTQARFVLAHRCANVVKGLLEDGIDRHIILRGDEGNDNDQYDYDLAPESEAERYLERFILPEIFGRPEFPRRGYNSGLGPCERYPTGWLDGIKWRARFELTLCRLMQNRLQLPYGCLSVSIGNMEASHIQYFAPVFEEAAFLSAHLYAEPRSVVVDDFDTVPWFMWRPLKIWHPECVRLGVRIPPVVATEVGPYYPPWVTGIDAREHTQLCIDIVNALDYRFHEAGVPFIGGMGFAFGSVGEMEVWRMDGNEQMIADEHPNNATIFIPGEAHMPSVGQGFQKYVPIIGNFREDEKYHGNDGPPQSTTSVAIADRGSALWHKASNMSLCVTADGRIFGDKRGALAVPVEYVPKA